MTVRITAVSFLNALPLIDRLSAVGHSGVVLDSALPSRLAGLLEAGKTDVALLPVVEVFRGRSSGFFSRSGIACRGAVDSVKLFTASPLSALQRIGADRGSRTSAALLRIVLLERHGVEPRFDETEPIPGELPRENEGILVIGDRCFEYERALAGAGTAVEVHDLGRMWHDWTGLPFVFAVWAAAPGFPERVGPERIAEVAALLDSAREHGLANLERLAEALARDGRLGVGGQSTPEAIHRYFSRSLTYRLGDGEMAGIRLFHELCRKHGLVPDGPLAPVFSQEGDFRVPDL